MDCSNTEKNQEQSLQHRNIDGMVKLEQMLDLEAKLHLQNSNDETFALHFTPNQIWRDRVAQWCYDVADHLNECRSVVYVAMYILDHYCALKTETENEALDERSYEIASLASFFLAFRVSGYVSLDVADLVSMSRGRVTIQEILSVGKEIVQGMKWNYRLLTPFDFVRTFVSILSSHLSPLKLGAVLNEAAYLCELAVSDFELMHTRASDLAIAATLNSLELNAKSHVKTFGGVVKGGTGILVEAGRFHGIRSRLKVLYCGKIADAGPQIPNIILEDDQERDDLSSVVENFSDELYAGLVHVVSLENLDYSGISTGTKRNLHAVSSSRKLRRME